MMAVVQSWIAPRGSERTALGAELVEEYVARSRQFCPCERELHGTEEAFWAGAEGAKQGRGRAVMVLLDSRGRQMSSEEFAGRLGRWRDDGVRRVILAVGPADGWSEASRGRADLVLSLGLMTLPHQLARVVLAEQVYRALTILAGHPYHCGH